jgi:subtilisin
MREEGSIVMARRFSRSKSYSRWVLAALGVCGLFGGLTLSPTPPAAVAQGAAGDRIPGQYIVVLNDGSPGAVAREMAQRHGLGVGHVYQWALRGFSAVIPDARLEAVKSDPRVRYVFQDRAMYAITPPWAVGRPGGGGGSGTQTTPWGVLRVAADKSTVADIDGVDERVNVGVAVIDTGIDLAHPDLFVAGGANFATGSSYQDGNGHGTHVAGTIGALDNRGDVVGVAPGVPLYAVRVLNNAGMGSWSSVTAGVDWVTANAGSIRVANMSLGGSDSGYDPANDPLDQAIDSAVAAGVTFVVAAGNDGANAAGFTPANHPRVITVAASDKNDAMASWSNYGSLVDVIAPGASILSTKKGGGTTTMSGTSMASPHVAGVAALCIARGHASSPADVATHLKHHSATLQTFQGAYALPLCDVYD